jgi:hypothetical protein
MNLYLILALAFGAAAAAPVAQSRVTNVVHLECGGRAAALKQEERQHSCRTPESIRPPARRPSLAVRRILTGAATPRAPAVS